jgi:hypothetical protein
LFDVSGVVHWYAFFSHPSGIQRVTEKLIASLSGVATSSSWPVCSEATPI